MGSRRGMGSGKTPKKNKSEKVEQGNTIRENLLKYERVYVVRFNYMKTDRINDIRRKYRSSTLCFAKHKILNHSLGLTADTEARPQMHLLNQYIDGQSALFMTNEPHSEVISFFSSLTEPEFANAGFVATESYVVPEGPLSQFSFSMDGFLRELGLPVRLENGVITNVRDYEVCSPGQTLTKNQANLLKQFQVKMDSFQAQVVALWENGAIQTPQ